MQNQCKHIRQCCGAGYGTFRAGAATYILFISASETENLLVFVDNAEHNVATKIYLYTYTYIPAFYKRFFVDDVSFFGYNQN